jgi:hypothetical protein
MSYEIKQAVTVQIGGATLAGTVSGFPGKRAEYATRPVIVKIGPAEYVTVDLSKVTGR